MQAFFTAVLSTTIHTDSLEFTDGEILLGASKMEEFDDRNEITNLGQVVLGTDGIFSVLFD